LALELIARAGRDKKKHALYVFRCSCGREITLRKDKAAQQDTCGDCLSAAATPPTSPAPSLPSPEPILDAPIPEQGTAEWYRAEIASKQKTIAKLEQQESDYGLILQTEGIQPSDGVTETPDKIWTRIVSALGKFRKELARLKKELTKLEAAKATPKDPHDLYRSKIDALRASQQAVKS
jgi:hypothetical protein